MGNKIPKEMQVWHLGVCVCVCLEQKISSTLKYPQDKVEQESLNSNDALGAIYFILIHFLEGRGFGI